MRRRVALLIFVMVLNCGAPAARRPRITGISHVAFYTSDAVAAKHFYGDLLGLQPGAWSGVYLVGTQGIEAEAKAPPNVLGRLSHIAFRTSDAEKMRLFLKSHRVAVPHAIHEEKSGTRWFAMNDPEGHPIEFVQERSDETSAAGVSQRVIHGGFVVRDRESEDKFYRDLLGFRVYWHGGMKEDQTDWVDMQVPNGTDWLEYMLVGKDSVLDKRTLGILNHAALGVESIKDAQTALEARGWKPTDDEHAQIGRDGKWQLNLYDPDGTRVELMEFKPVAKPCCSEYARRHPRKYEKH
jgi:catechol 2,3-dioxygenase-like lactoylglutathione lyase family enzyme